MDRYGSDMKRDMRISGGEKKDKWRKVLGGEKKKYFEDLAQEAEEAFYLRGYRRQLMKNMENQTGFSYNRSCGDQIATLMLMNFDGILPSS